MTDQQIDDFLAHFGVKGMHWGQRKAEDDGAPRTSRLSDDQKRKLKTALKVAGAVAIVGGIVATAVILQKNGKLPAFSLPKPKVKVPEVDNLNTVKLQTFQPKTLNLNQAPKNPSKMDAAFKFVSMLNDAKKSNQVPPKLDPETQKFIDDSAKRQAADNLAFRSQAKKDLESIESDPFMLQYMRGKNPEALARLMEAARGD